MEVIRLLILIPPPTHHVLYKKTKKYKYIKIQNTRLIINRIWNKNNCKNKIVLLLETQILTLLQRSLTRSRKIKLFEPSKGIFRDPTKYWTTKKICKIGPLGPKEKIDFFSFFLMRKRLSSGQKWFLRPYFPPIRGMFVFRMLRCRTAPPETSSYCACEKIC